jgi:NCAIR mutase (PurE)-related protein
MTVEGFARLDHGRNDRTGHPEVVLGDGKTVEQVRAIVTEMIGAGTSPIVVTRASRAQAKVWPDASYDELARLLTVRSIPAVPGAPQRVAVVTGGTSDLPVAREALGTLEAFGVPAFLIPDAGVTGLHRTLDALPHIRDAEVGIVIAGMEGTLPTVLAGLVAIPLIAVPTSVGYGAAFDGLAALLGMLASCAPGITVVNIDNGFGAALAALRILSSGGRR